MILFLGWWTIITFGEGIRCVDGESVSLLVRSLGRARSAWERDGGLDAAGNYWRMDYTQPIYTHIHTRARTHTYNI